jgi:predicted DNA-binding protein
LEEIKIMGTLVSDKNLMHEAKIVWLVDISKMPWVRESEVNFFTRKEISKKRLSELEQGQTLVGYAELENDAPPTGTQKCFIRRIFTLRENDYEVYKVDNPTQADHPSEAVEPLSVEPKHKGLSPSKKSQIAVRVPRSLFSKLKRYVQQTGISQTDVIVSALAKHLDSVEDLPMIQRILELEKRVDALEIKI